MKTYANRLLATLLIIVLIFTSAPFVYGAETKTLTADFTSSIGKTRASADIMTVTADTFDGCYGNQLSKMAREIYDTFEEDFEISYNPSEIIVKFEEKYLFDSIEELSAEIGIAGQAALDAFHFDHPEIFWFYLCSSSYNIGSFGDKYTVFTMRINVEELYEGASSKGGIFESAVNSAYEEIKSSVSDLENRREVLRKIHDYVCENATYATTFTNTVYSPASFFIGDKSLVCEGYSKTFKILCDKFGIPCTLVSGTADTNTQTDAPHMWIYVQMDDGRWYLVDTTWDDQDSRIYDTYFLANYNSDGFYKKISEER